MALLVEVSGIGVCRSPTLSISSYSAFIISVQQESYQIWTIYRRYQTFLALYDHLKSGMQLYGFVPPLPHCDPNNYQIPYLETCATAIDIWLKSIASNPNILRSQFMYQFLCVDANLPPPHLDIYWKKGSLQAGSDDMLGSNYDIMDDMDDPLGDKNSMEQFSMSFDDSPSHLSSSYNRCNADDHSRMNSGWNYSNSGLPPTGRSHQQHHYGGQSNHYGSSSMNGNKRGFDGIEEDGDADDGLDIKTLSSVKEAEFLYDKSVDGNLNMNKLTGQPLPQSNPQANTMQSNQSDQIEASGSGSTNLLAMTLANGNGQSVFDADTGKIAPKINPKRKINLDSFHIIKVIGKGSFGKVFLVREKSSSTLYALKVLKKDYIISKNQVEHTLTERSVLGYIHHPFIVALNMAFQTSDKLFFVLDYCSGGELFFHLGKIGRFSEERAKFYAAQITLALEYVHSLDVIYRDLKPENVLLDASGNVRLTDFGLSKEGVSNHSTGAFSFCGTPEYIAPEVLLRQGHGRAVDWWSLGALLYEMMAGLPPFYSRNRETMFEKIMKADLSFPPFMSEMAKDILTKFLIRDPKQRLGSGERDALEVKEHPFFRDIDWDGLYQGKITAPWTPAVVGSLDTSQFDQEFTSMNPTVSPDVRGAFMGPVDPTFEGFSFVDEAAARLMSQHYPNSAAASYSKGGSGLSMLSSTINSKRSHA